MIIVKFDLSGQTAFHFIQEDQSVEIIGNGKTESVSNIKSISHFTQLIKSYLGSALSTHEWELFETEITYEIVINQWRNFVVGSSRRVNLL